MSFISRRNDDDREILCISGTLGLPYPDPVCKGSKSYRRVYWNPSISVPDDTGKILSLVSVNVWNCKAFRKLSSHCEVEYHSVSFLRNLG